MNTRRSFLLLIALSLGSAAWAQTPYVRPLRNISSQPVYCGGGCTMTPTICAAGNTSCTVSSLGFTSIRVGNGTPGTTPVLWIHTFAAGSAGLVGTFDGPNLSNVFAIEVRNAGQCTVSMSPNPANITEGATKSFTVTLSPAVPVETTTYFYRTGGTSDFNESWAEATVPAGALSAIGTLATLQDSTPEPTETVTYQLYSCSTALVSPSAPLLNANIIDDDRTVSLSVSSNSLVEAGGTATVTATLSSASSGWTTAYLGLLGSATKSVDYSPSGEHIDIPPNALSGSRTLTSIHDTLDEANETIEVFFTAVIGAKNGSGIETVTIIDNDPPPNVTLSASTTTIAEAAGTATVTATLSAVSGRPVTITLGFTGTASNPADYTRSGTSISIPAGSLSGSVTLTAVNDTAPEPNETIIVDITGATNATEAVAQQRTVTIIDDEVPQASLSLSGSPLVENGGVATVTATLDRTHSQAITVNLAFTGTATNPTDYTRSAASITIPIGSTTGSITLTSVHDTADEANETIIVDISSVTNGMENGTQRVTATITDDDVPQVTLGLSGSPLAENAGVATVTATLDRVSFQTVTVSLGFTGTATNPADYTRSGASIAIAAGNTTGTITLTGVNDTADETDETILVDVSSVTNGAESGTQQVTATITDDDTPQVTLSLTGSPLAENAGVATVRATLDRVSFQAVTVNLAFSGTATNVTDYTRSGASIAIAAGSTTGTITLTGVQDTSDEANETILVDVSSVTNGAESGTQQVTATITDDDVPQVSLSLTGSPFAENAGVATVTATLDRVSFQAVTVTLGFSGTATNVTDYTRSGASIAIAAGSTTGTITLTGVDDTNDEADESVIVNVTAVTNGSESGTQQVTATIADDDAPQVTLGLTGNPLAENGGVATVTATLDRVSFQTVTVSLGFGGTATNVSDYTRSSASIAIAAGSLTGSITLTGVNDTADEADETIVVDISAVTNGGESGTQQVTATITDDDAPQVTLGLTGSPLAENGGVATVTATLDRVSFQTVTVNLGFSGTATNVTDYTRSGAAVAIPAGSLTGTVTLTAVDDATDEAGETIVVDVSTVTNGNENGTQQVTATITDDDVPQAALSLTGSPLAENGGAATVTATLDRVSFQTVTVSLGFSGTAAHPADYTRSGVSIAIAAGSLTGTVTLTGVNDTTDEADETILADITSVTNGLESGVQQVTATILDDDAPQVTLSLTGSPLAENGGVATVTATLDRVPFQTVTVSLAFSGTATGATDFTASGTSIAIPAGSTTGTITLTGVDDVLDETDETILVDITSVTNGVESGTQQITATITDDDAPLVTLSLTGSPIAENGGAATVTATLDRVSFQTVTVDLGFAGTATNVEDYTRSGGSIAIAAGSLTGTITLSGVDDAVDEGDETIVVDLTSVTNGSESGTQQVTATINDDDVPQVMLSLTGSPLVENGGTATVTATLDRVSFQAITIDLGFTGTAASPDDYTRSGAQIVIAAGDLTGNVTLTSVDDSLDEADETIVVDVALVMNGSEIGTQQGIATITDDDIPLVTLGPATSTLGENGGVATLTATLDRVSFQPVTVSLDFGGTATHATDYSASATIVIAAGSLTGTMDLTGVDDTIDEADETIVVDIASVTNGDETGTQQVTATITDDDVPQASLSLTGSPLAENAGVATITATLDRVSFQPVTIQLEFSGTATNVSDYARSGASIAIPAGSLTGSVTLTGADDALAEPDETVAVDIDTVTNGAESGAQQVVATITDDDTPQVALSVTGSPLAENGGVATVTATLDRVTFQPVTVDLGFAGTATNVSDYTRSGASIVIAAGDLTGSITLSGVDDSSDEDAETVVIDIASVTNGNETGTQQVTVTIADDDVPQVSLSLAGGTLAENGGVATVTATLDRASFQTVTIDLGFGGTSTNPADYTRSGVQIAIAAGSLTGAITLTAVDDTSDEDNESILIEVTAVTNGAETGSQQVTATITDDDTPQVTLALTGSPLAENGGVSTVTATLDRVSFQDVTVSLGFGGTATNATDYTRSESSITIDSGSLTGTITLTGSDDTTDESDESIVVDITTVTNASETGTQQVTATITDDDAAPSVTLGLSGAPLAESGGTATVTATLSAASELPVTVTLELTGTATSPADFTASGSSIAIAAGATSGTITLAAASDTVDEDDETIVVAIASTTNATESVPQSVIATITDDDAPPTVTLGLLGSPFAETGGSATATVTLSEISERTVTVTLGFTGTAASPSDYTASATSLTIAPGSSAASVTLSASADTLDESNETVIVTITGATNATEAAEQELTATITDDDDPPTVTLALAGSPFAENAGVATVTATLSALSAQPVTVELTFSGSASTNDYETSAGSVTIAAGTTSASVTLTGTSDTLDELDETVIVDIAAVTNGTETASQQVTATITDDDDPTHLVFGTQPSTAATGDVIAPAVTVQLLDASEHLVNTTRSVTLAIGANPSAGVLRGTVTIAAVGGVATFENLSLNRAGEGYTLVATSSGLTPAMSNAFTIVPGASAIVSGDGSICAGDVATITAELSGTAPWRLTWSDGVEETVSTALTTRLVTPDVTTTYTLTEVRDDNGEGSTAGSATVTVNDVVPPVISGPTFVVLGSSLQLTATSGFDSYHWFRDGLAIAGELNATLTIRPATASDAGAYTVIGVEGDCSASSAVFAVSVGANEAILPVIGATQGAGGALFRTTIQLVNDGDAAIDGDIDVLAAAVGLTNAPYHYALGARESRFYEDVVPFGAGLASANVVPKTGLAPLGLVHVFNDMGSRGTTGMIERPVMSDDALSQGDHAVLIAPADPVATRFNVGVRALRDGLTLHGVVRDASGAVRTEFDRSYPPSSFAQTNAASFTGVALGGSDVISIEVVSGGGVIYGAATDNRTNDPNMQFAQTVRASEGETRYVMTVVGSTAGNFGSHFRTGVQIHNPTGDELEAQLVFHPAGRSGSDGDRSMTLKVAPNATKALPDLLEAMGTTGVGSLDLITASATRPIAVVRVYNTGDSGETSMTEELLATSDALREGQSAVLLAPHDPSAARFNIGVRSLGDGAKILAVVRNAAGTELKRVRLAYPAMYFEQRSAADHLGVTVNGDESVTYTVEEGAVFVYGVWTDNRTQDPSLHFALVR